MNKRIYIIVTPSPSDPDIKCEVYEREDIPQMIDWEAMEPGEKYNFKVVSRTIKWFEKLPEIN